MKPTINEVYQAFNNWAKRNDYHDRPDATCRLSLYPDDHAFVIGLDTDDKMETFKSSQEAIAFFNSNKKQLTLQFQE